jgi:hypothetical protein
MYRRRSVVVLAVTGVATWALTIGVASLAAAQDTSKGYTLRFEENYTMIRGPEGVLWCPQFVISELRLAAMSRLTDRAPLRLASLTQRGATEPIFDVLLPRANDVTRYTLNLASDGHVYYVDGVTDQRNNQVRSVPRVYAYLSPAEFAALAADPTPCLSIKPANVPSPELLYGRLMSGHCAEQVRQRAPKLCEALDKLLKAREQPLANPNELWTKRKYDPELFAQGLYTLLGVLIGHDTETVSLYNTNLYADTTLPIQIAQVILEIRELGGPYSNDGVVPSVSAPIDEASNDPWQGYRPDQTTANQAPATPTAPAPSAAAIQKLRFLNRLLLEYELDGALQGTMYRWIKDLPAYEPCGTKFVPGKMIKDFQSVYTAYSAEIMPMTFSNDGRVLVLLDALPPDQAAAGETARSLYWVVGPGGKLQGPSREAPQGETFTVRGRDIRWVDVEKEGQVPDPGLWE